MARFLSQTLIRSIKSSNSLQSRKFGNRFSSLPQLIEIDLDSEGDVEVLGLRKLDDAFHNFIVKQSAPDWLPFVPGSSYWVPPRRPLPESHALFESFKNLMYPLSEDESMSLSTSRGWPSSDYFIQGTSPMHLVEMKADNNKKNISQPDDEEG